MAELTGPPHQAPRDRTPALFAGVEPLEVFVELLAELDTDQQAGVLRPDLRGDLPSDDDAPRGDLHVGRQGPAVRAVGAHGTPFAPLAALRPTLLDTPIAQKALLDDQVIVVSERIEEAVPPEYAALLGITTLVCTPMSAAGRRTA